MENSKSTLFSKENVGQGERLASLLAGSFFLHRAIFGKNHLTNAVISGLLLSRGGTGYCAMYDAMDIDTMTPPEAVQAKTTITVNKPKQEVYNFWRNLSNLPLFMKHLKEINVVDENHSTWKAKIPGGLGNVQWDSKILTDKPGEEISWSSMPDSQIENRGTVKFLDAGKFGTEINVDISYHPPAGNIGEGVAKLLTPALEKMIKEDIRNFRRIIESGELPTIEGQAKGEKNKTTV